MTRALVITRAWPQHPEQATHGIYQRLSMFLEALCQTFDTVEVLVFAPPNHIHQTNTLRYEALLQGKHGVGIQLNVHPRSPNPNPWSLKSRYLAGITSIDRQEDYINVGGPSQVKAVQAALARKPALVFAHRLHTFTPLWPLLPVLKVPLLFDMDDIEHRALARNIVARPLWPSERLRLMHVPAVMWRERQAIRLSSASFVCSQDDATALRKLASTDRVHVIPNTVNAPDHFHHNTSSVDTLGFIGSFAHTPNIDAVQWLLADIWPQIRHARPNARLRIGGAGSLNMFGHAHGKDGVEILDFVDDLGAYYQSLNLVIAPLRFGAGTRVKIIEAAGYAMPIVSTTLGAEGLAFNNGTEILLADKPDHFADQCVQLLENQDNAIEIGLTARRCFEQHYNRNAVVASINEHIRCALAETPNKKQNELPP